MPEPDTGEHFDEGGGAGGDCNDAICVIHVLDSIDIHQGSSQAVGEHPQNREAYKTSVLPVVKWHAEDLLKVQGLAGSLFDDGNSYKDQPFKKVENSGRSQEAKVKGVRRWKSIQDLTNDKRREDEACIKHGIAAPIITTFQAFWHIGIYPFSDAGTNEMKKTESDKHQHEENGENLTCIKEEWCETNGEQGESPYEIKGKYDTSLMGGLLIDQG